MENRICRVGKVGVGEGKRTKRMRIWWVTEVEVVR
jgi:hypothetical protein